MNRTEVHSLREMWDRVQKGTEPPLGHVDLDVVRFLAKYLKPFAQYFRFEARHMERIPKGHTLLVANHSGGKLPIDMFLLGLAWYEHFRYERPLFTLLHDFLFKFGVAKRAFRRFGGIPAHPKNARALLELNESVLVLPGGDYETFRPYSERYKVDFGRRTGFVDIALRTKVPITPVVTIGSHEIFFVLTRGERIAKYLGMKALFRYNAFPIILGFPAGLYVGPIPSPFPLPSKMTQEFLEPVYLHEEEADHRAYSEDDLKDAHARLEMQRVIVRRMQAAMDRLAKERKFPILG